MSSDKSKSLLSLLKKKQKAKIISFNKLAKKMKYSNHTVVTNWIKTSRVPLHAQAKLAQILAGAK